MELEERVDKMASTASILTNSEREGKRKERKNRKESQRKTESFVCMRNGVSSDGSSSRRRKENYTQQVALFVAKCCLHNVSFHISFQ
jgi:hypothetical protein